MKSEERIKAALIGKGYPEEDAARIASAVRDKGAKRDSRDAMKGLARDVAGVKR